MEYERVTMKNGLLDCTINCGNEMSCIGCIGNVTRALERLAELEDRIEAGTLVTVPYAIGQELYSVHKNGYFGVEKVKVSLITIKHDGGVDIRLNHYRAGGGYSGCFKYDTKYYQLFDTEEEAEKRLEEIKNETKSIDNSEK